MTEISSHEEFEEWLKDKPANWGQVIAARSALRVAPLALNDESISADTRFTQAIVRANFISWAAHNFPAHDMKAGALTAASAALAAASAADTPFAANAAYDAALTAASAAALAAAGAASAASAANAAYDAALTAASAGAIWQSIEDDARYLENNAANNSSQSLSTKPLWFADQIPHDIHSEWMSAKYQLEQSDGNFIHWINWYERRLIGHDAAFQIFNDTDSIEDIEVLKKLADATNEDFWGKGSEYVNQQLSNWLHDARQRAQERHDAENIGDDTRPRTDEEIKSSLSSTASPQIQVEDGILTAAPNQEFDKPQYSDDLANLPTILRTFIDTLINSLPTQAAPIVRNSLTAYQEELLVRGTQPILPIVKGFASSIAAQVLNNADDLENTPPDQWTLKDEREWDDGTADLFGTFFKYHLDLINHFPMDEEREEILSNLPIDETAASGNALIEPIEKVNEIILAMVDKGYASHDIGKIIKAHSQYNRDIAGLLPHSGDVDPKIVTPKRRHVLNTQGLYLNIYNTILATASFANSITPAQIDWIMQSIQTLMGFIIR